MGWYDRKVRRVRDLSCGDTRIFLEVEVRRVECRRCGKVKQERLDFLADNPFYTKRFAYYVGQRCRAAPIKDVAKDLALDWHTVKALDKQYMEAQLKRVGTPGPQVIGVDEISIRKGHDYRIVVSDLVRGRPIWFGGEDRSEASMSQFYAWLGNKKSSRKCGIGSAFARRKGHNYRLGPGNSARAPHATADHWVTAKGPVEPQLCKSSEPSLVAGSGPRPSLKASSSRRCPRNHPGRA